MVGKNNTQERFRRNATKDKRYTLKKLSVGLASVALGTVLFLNGAETVSAETEVSEPNETTDALSEVEQVTQPVQSTFQFSYVRNGGQIDGFTGDYANAHEAEKAFRHHANQHGYTLLNIRLEGNTFIADVQADNSTFQFNYLNETTGEKLDSFFGDYLNASEAEKDFRNYANEHGYTLSNVRLEGNTFTADVAVAEESQPAESTFQFIYRNKETGKKLDGFFGDYSNASEAEKDFRNYANQHGYTLSNIRKNGQTFTADVVRQEQSGTTDSDRYVEAAKQRARQLINALDNLTAEQKADYLAQVEAAESVAQVEAVYDEAKNVVNAVEKDYSYTLNFGDRTESANFGEFDSEEQAELALRILTNEKGYKLSNLRLEGRTFIADAKVETEQDQSSEQTNRYLQEAKKRALEIINGLENLFDTQKPSYLERIEDADSVAAVEAIVEEAQNYVNESKGGENGQAAEEPERPEYNPEQNLVTYDIQITDYNGKTQTQRVTFPSRELALNYISQLVRSYEKAGVVLNEERSDVEGRDNTFILVFEKKQAEQKPDEKPELDVPTPNENAPAPEKLDTAKAEALAAIAGLKYLSAKEKEELVELINEADNLTEVNYLVGAAYKLNINKFPGKVPAPEELDVAKAEALDAIAGLEYLSEEEKAGFVERINETVELGEVNRLVSLAFKRNIEKLPEKTPEQDPEEEAGRELDAAKAEALAGIAGLEYLSEEEKAGFVERINETVELGEVNRLVGLAFKRNIEKLPEKTPEQDPEEEAGRELDAAKAEALDAIAGLEYLSEEEKAGFVERINETVELGEVNRLVGLAFKRNIENFPEKTPEQDPEEEAGRELDAAKAEALAGIAGLKHLSEEEKAKFKQQIDTADTIGAIQNIVNEAEKQAYANTVASEKERLLNELDETVNTIQDAIDANDSLTDEEKNLGHVVVVSHGEVAQELLANASTLEEINEIIEATVTSINQAVKELEAKSDARSAIDDAVTAKEAAIDKSDLSSDAKTTLKAQVNKYADDAKKAIGDLNNAEEVASRIGEVLSAITLMGIDDASPKGDAKDSVDQLDALTSEEKAEFKKRIDSADTSGAIQNIVNEAEERAYANTVESEKTRLLKEISETVDNIQDVIEANDNLTEEEKNLGQVVVASQGEVAQELLLNASTLEEISEIMEATVESINLSVKELEAKSDARSAIDDAVTAKEAAIDKSDLSSDAKTTLKAQVNKYADDAKKAIGDLNNAEEVASRIGEVLSAITLMGIDDISPKGDAKDSVDQLDALTSEEKAEFKKRIDSADTIGAIQNIVNEAEKQAYANTVASEKERLLNELDETVNTIQDAIDANDSLTDEEKNLGHVVVVSHGEVAQELLANASTLEEINEIIEATVTSINQAVKELEAKSDARSAIDDAVTAKETAIDKSDLSEKAKTTLKAQVKQYADDAKKAIGDLNNAEEVANRIGEAIREIILMGIDDVSPKGDAKDSVDQLAALTPEEKAKFKQQIDTADTPEAIQEILDEAEKQAHAKTTVNKDELDEIVDILNKIEAEEATDDLLERQKDEARTGDSSINSLTDLSEKIRNELQEQINNAQNEEEILKILSKAANRNELNKTVKAAIAGMPELTEQQKNEYKQQVDDAKADDEVEAVLSELESKAFENYKESSKNQVKDLTRLSEKEKQDFKNKIDEKESVNNIDEVLGEAYKQNTQKAIERNQAVAKVEAAVKNAVKASNDAKKELEKAKENSEVSATDQGRIRAANDTVKESKAEAQKLLVEFSSKYTEELNSNKGLKEQFEKLKEQLEEVNEVDVPRISEETLEKFKQDAIEYLYGVNNGSSKTKKSLVPDLEDSERKVYEEIIKKMDAKDDSEKNINEIIQVAIAENLLKKQNKIGTSITEKIKQRVQTALNFVDETLEEGQNYPEYKKELLKQKQRVQNLLNGQTGNTIPTPPMNDSQTGGSDSKVTFGNMREEVTRELNKLSDKVKKVDTEGPNKSTLTKEYREQYEKFEELLSKWEQLASNDKERAGVQGIRDILRGYKR
ncbi:DUF1542 domain-containing protein [Dolosigranulum savutiense]|uniref:DUF1542 domain-containing protein n=1 Tax=Dolosigranulum savutiense TaxID=3110288 RepID=A0AB74TRN1_9LACT